jgi:hypothetical protein
MALILLIPILTILFGGLGFARTSQVYQRSQRRER